MKQRTLTALIVLAIFLIVAGCIYAEYSIWVECRATHSWLYCLRLLSR